ncbi:MAG: hypothetical protein DRJ35_03395 [Thermoprotei archaeon]|nr:MAG: hypothetical protein DRJ35_03395 [Thermoprotei archaeon]
MITITIDKKVIAAIAIVVLLAAGYIVGTIYFKPLTLSYPESRPATPAPLPVSREGKAAEPGTPQGAPSTPAKTVDTYGGENQQYQIPPRKIVYTASMTLEVENVEATVNAVYGVASKYGGYVAWTHYYKDRVEKAEVTIKVPVDYYRQALDDLRKLGEVKSFSENAQDVTDYYMDLEARLRNLKAEEERLLEYLEKAQTISEILQVEDHLARIRGQIEWLEAQLKNLERRVDYATISVTITSKYQPEEPIEWPKFNMLKIIRDAILVAITITAGIIIIIIGLAPLYIPAAIIYIIYKKKKTQKLAKQTQPSQNV